MGDTLTIEYRLVIEAEVKKLRENTFHQPTFVEKAMCDLWDARERLKSKRRRARKKYR